VADGCAIERVCLPTCMSLSPLGHLMLHSTITFSTSNLRISFPAAPEQCLAFGPPAAPECLNVDFDRHWTVIGCNSVPLHLLLNSCGYSMG
jgi:hypothetical protein